MTGLLTLADSRAKLVVAWLDRTGWGMAVRAVAYTGTVGWTLALDSDLVPDSGRWKLVGYIGCFSLFVVSAMLLKHSRAAEHDQATADLARIRSGLRSANAALAGSFEDIACALDRQASKRVGLTEERSKTMCIAMLARIRTLAHLALGTESDRQRLRVTLAVPIRESETVVALQVWCYDQTYADRRFTRMDILWDGAPEAFRRRATAIIEDLNTLDTPAAKEGRSFRSVVCYPIRPRNSNGLEPLGVVSINAEEEGFFTLDRQSRLNTYIQPVVQGLGIPLASRYSNEKYKFG